MWTMNEISNVMIEVGHLLAEKDDRITEMEECLAGFMICGALNGMYLSPEMEAWCTKVLADKKRTPAQIWCGLFETEKQRA